MQYGKSNPNVYLKSVPYRLFSYSNGKRNASWLEIVTIEIHRNEANQAEQNISKANIPAKVKIISGNALDVIPTLQGTFDFVFIDAEKTEYLLYLKAIEPKLHMVQWYLLITQVYLLHRWLIILNMYDVAWDIKAAISKLIKTGSKLIKKFKRL